MLLPKVNLSSSVIGILTKSTTLAFQLDLVSLNAHDHGHNFKDRMQLLNLAATLIPGGVATPY
jgi:hypothetical protein